jgi:hypothetical protein
MRLFELEQPSVGDILEIELGDTIVEAVITAIEGDEIIAETDNYRGASILAESYGRYYCSTDKKWKTRKGPKQTRKVSEEQGVAEEKTRLDPKCWDGYKKAGTKMKGGVRVNNCVKEDEITEAEYQGRKVALGKPMQGDTKKFKVYVKDPSTGNVKKVNFGDPNMRIKKSNPKRRKSFRARHNCANPGPKTKARYWSCRKW